MIRDDSRNERFQTWKNLGVPYQSTGNVKMRERNYDLSKSRLDGPARKFSNESGTTRLLVSSTLPKTPLKRLFEHSRPLFPSCRSHSDKKDPTFTKIQPFCSFSTEFTCRKRSGRWWHHGSGRWIQEKSKGYSWNLSLLLLRDNHSHKIKIHSRRWHYIE